MLFPIGDRGFSNTQNLGNLNLIESKLKPPLSDVLAERSGILRDFRRFRAGEDNWQNRYAGVPMRTLRKPASGMHLHPDANPEIRWQDFGSAAG